MKSIVCFFAFCFFLFSLSPETTASPPTSSTIGVTYSHFPTPSSPPPPPADSISAAISTLRLQSIRLMNPDPDVIRSFAFTNTSLFLSIPNSFLPPLAVNRSLAHQWVFGHVLPFYPRSKISLISVGNDAVSDLAPYLIPAIRNVHFALLDLGIRKVFVSTTFSFVNVVTTAFPPSSATFQRSLCDFVIEPLLRFLEETNSSFLVNLYPYNMYRLNLEIPIGFALFQEHPFNFRDDMVTGVRYRNLFDMMVDAVITSLAVAGHENIPVVVAETGWPSSGGDPVEVDATPAYAEMYLRGLIGHLRSGLGTPLRREGLAEVYIYELVDKEGKQGTRNWGILHANMTKKYNIDFSGNDRTGMARVLYLGICFLLIFFFQF